MLGIPGIVHVVDVAVGGRRRRSGRRAGRSKERLSTPRAIAVVRAVGRQIRRSADTSAMSRVERNARTAVAVGGAPHLEVDVGNTGITICTRRTDGTDRLTGCD